MVVAIMRDDLSPSQMRRKASQYRRSAFAVICQHRRYSHAFDAAHALVIIDGAAFHTASMLTIPGNNHPDQEKKLERFRGKAVHRFSVRKRTTKTLEQIIDSNELGFALVAELV